MMRQFSVYFGSEPNTYPVIDYGKIHRYVDGQKTEILDNRYTVLYNYEQINIIVSGSENVVTQEQIRNAADTGAPMFLEFYDLSIVIRPKDKWEIQASGRASQVKLVKDK